MGSLKPPEEDALWPQAATGRPRRFRRWWTTVGLGSLLLASLVFLIGAMQSGSMDAFVQRANGQELVVEFDAPDLAHPSELVQSRRGKTFVRVPVTVRNFASVPRNILGEASDCHCVAANRLPQRVEPRGQGSIDVTIQIEPGESSLDHVVTLYSDSPVNSVLTFRVVSRDR